MVRKGIQKVFHPLFQVGQTEVMGIFMFATVDTSYCFPATILLNYRGSSMHLKKYLILMQPPWSSPELISDSSVLYTAGRFWDSRPLHHHLTLPDHQTIGGQHDPAVGFEDGRNLPILCLVCLSCCQVWHDLWRIWVKYSISGDLRFPHSIMNDVTSVGLSR